MARNGRVRPLDLALIFLWSRGGGGWEGQAPGSDPDLQRQKYSW